MCFVERDAVEVIRAGVRRGGGREVVCAGDELGEDGESCGEAHHGDTDPVCREQADCVVNIARVGRHERTVHDHYLLRSVRRRGRQHSPRETQRVL